MKIFFKMLGITLGGVVVLVIAALVVVHYLLGVSCKNKLVSEMISPNGLQKVIVFRRDCGSTTGFSTNVSVVGASGNLGNSAGNIFVADTNHGDAPSFPDGGPVVDLEWKSSKLLVVSYHAAARVFKSEPEVSSVKILYQTKEK